MNSYATRLLLLFLLLCRFNVLFAQDPLSKLLKRELKREFRQLQKADSNVYYISYRLEDITTYRVTAGFGVIYSIDSSRSRIFTPMIRIGSYQLDNTHNVSANFASAPIRISDQPDLLLLQLWKATDQAYRNARHAFELIQTNQKVRVAEEDTAADFSAVTPTRYFDPPQPLETLRPDLNQITRTLKAVTAELGRNPDLLQAGMNFEYSIKRKYFVDTDGSELVENATGAWEIMFGNSKAADGMELPLYQSYFSYTPDGLPGRDSLFRQASEMSKKLSALCRSPLAEPFVGPAILSGRAAGVFFHEIFGHRLEGKRMKSERDGQTFKTRMGTAVLPAFLSIAMDPTKQQVAGATVNGFYRFDDEGVRARRVEVVDKGILKNFLMTRTPINGVTGSNGHARTSPGGMPESRQSNLIVETQSGIGFQQLREELIAACKRQNKAYGYLFQDVQGGFTNVGRTAPNAFNVIPTEVYKIYADGRPVELVRGVDLIGTPLSMFMRIVAAGNQLETFNGMCGSGSGWVPVSASSPAIFVDQIETQKKNKSSELPPVLPRPDLDTAAIGNAAPFSNFQTKPLR